jgi:hypothetical protein
MTFYREHSLRNIHLADPESIKRLSRTYIVEEDHVKSYLNHLFTLQPERSKEIRSNQRKRDKDILKSKEYKDYEWKVLAASRESLNKLTVYELEKYLKYHKLSFKGLKKDKIVRIMAHINLSSIETRPLHYNSISFDEEEDKLESSGEESGGEDDEDSEDDEVITFVESDNELEDVETDDDSDEPMPQVYPDTVTSRLCSLTGGC